MKSIHSTAFWNVQIAGPGGEMLASRDPTLLAPDYAAPRMGLRIPISFFDQMNISVHTDRHASW